jgi:EmrB/QacA subfamily drug resistance transporter
MPPRDRVSRPALVLSATILASSLSFIDGSVINVGLPAIGMGLHSGATGLQWVINAYLLPLSALVLLGGALGDRLCRPATFALGIVLFAAASAACASAPSLAWLIAGRVLQGVGAALLTPNSLAILNDTFEGSARGRAIGLWAAASAATSGFGPVLGGWLIDTIGWRSIFVINLPLATAALLLLWRGRPPQTSLEGVRLDLVGALLATLGLGALTFGLVIGAGPAGWTRLALAGIGSGAIVLSGFLAWEAHCGKRAMVPVSLFASSEFSALTALTLFLYGALGALVVLLPYSLMKAGDATAAWAGASMLPVTILLAALSSAFGSLAGRVGARPLLAAGCATTAAGFFLFLRVTADSSYWFGLLPALLLIGSGLAAAVAPLTAAIMASVEPRLAGTASGFNNAVARTGGLIATACLGQALASSGSGLIEACHNAAVLAAGACLTAAVCALAVRKTGPSSAGSR